MWGITTTTAPGVNALGGKDGPRPDGSTALAPYFSAGALLGLLGCESPYRAVRGS